MSEDLWTLIRVLTSLLAVLMVVGLAARALRTSTRTGKGAGLQVRERVGLTRDAALAVVDLPGRRLVLGVTANRVDLLVELEPDYEDDEDDEDPAGRGPSPGRSRESHGVKVTPLPVGADPFLPRFRGGRRTGYPGAGRAGTGRAGTGAGAFGRNRRGLRQTMENLRDLTARRR
ncbi:MAG: flagellar biosynthetic protein FliO [Actinomycetota bacterium]|nr:flagellar biosynthetic protein FliO [Actinomycetota bacterium]